MLSKEELKNILEEHKKWLNNENEGKQADLSHADLSHADLRCADLYGANLCGADLSHADLSNADLSQANLKGADLSHADLSGAFLRHTDLSRADLSYADLSYADLSHADLSYADLSQANLKGADLISAINIPFIPQCEICPQEGSFIGFKKVGKHIIKLEITKSAKRSSATGRKCRCSEALVLSITNLDGSDSGLKHILNKNYAKLDYIVGEIIHPDSFDEDRWNECSNGIHFFITRQEAVDYN